MKTETAEQIKNLLLTTTAIVLLTTSIFYAWDMSKNPGQYIITDYIQLEKLSLTTEGRTSYYLETKQDIQSDIAKYKEANFKTYEHQISNLPLLFPLLFLTFAFLIAQIYFLKTKLKNISDEWSKENPELRNMRGHNNQSAEQCSQMPEV